MKVEIVPGNEFCVRVKDYYPDGQLNAFAPVPEAACVALGKGVPSSMSKVAVLDLAGCNMDCWWCYQSGRSEEIVDIGVPSIAATFSWILRESGVAIWRISGGEPTLQPELPELIDTLVRPGCLVWVNTNGGTPSRIPVHPGKLCVEISIKGFSDEVQQWNCVSGPSLSAQILSWVELIGMGHDVYANLSLLHNLGQWAKEDVDNFFGRLQKIHPALPLTIVPIKQKQYDWNPDWKEYGSAEGYWDLLMRSKYSMLDLSTETWMWVRQVGRDIRGEY